MDHATLHSYIPRTWQCVVYNQFQNNPSELSKFLPSQQNKGSKPTTCDASKIFIAKDNIAFPHGRGSVI